MSVDLASALNVGLTIVTLAILGVGIYRALGMRRAFVNGYYRSRATWSTLLMLVINITMVSNFIPTPNSGVLSAIGFVPFIALILVILAYADRSVLVAMETDFFHRNTLGWRRARLPVYVIYVAFAVPEFVVSAVVTPAELASPLGDAFNTVFFVVVVIILAYATAGMIIGARRSADRALRRSILLLGLALSTLVLSIVVTFPLTEGTLPFVIVNQGTAVVGIYLIYRSVMSLTLLGKVEKGV
jgi:hypothetical protein